jgi:molybdate transport system substrate-binding protein
VLATLASLAVGIGMPDPASAEEKKGAILVLAAASTTNAMDEIRRQFSSDTGIEVRASYAASSTLAQQVTNGADADVFISADQKWADFLAGKGFIAQRRNLLGNRLVIIVPKDSSLKLQQPTDLVIAAVEHVALGDPESVPAGRYAKQALTKLGVWDQIKGKVVSAEDVRQALAFVETGNAQAGIVYSTDAAVSKKVTVVAEVSPDLLEPIRYPVALLAHGKGRAEAEAFYRYLISSAAAKVFEKYGFSVLEPSKPESPK